MTNFEWLLKENVDFIKDSLSLSWIGVKDGGELDRCSNTHCDKCIFGKDTETPCKILRRRWLDAEHNPYAIPLNTPIDTKVLVSSNGTYWHKRYFAGFGEDKEHPYLAFRDGNTSWTNDEFDPVPWGYCKLA